MRTHVPLPEDPLRPRHAGSICALIILGLVMFSDGVLSQAQTYTVLHSFQGSDGFYPQGTLTLDAAGNLYGTATLGGANGFGTVFKLSRRGGVWSLSRLYSFKGGTDGGYPYAGVAIGPDGSLFGTTRAGGGGTCTSPEGYLGCGTVFNLRPATRSCGATQCPWVETVIHRFGGGSDGAFPGFGNLAVDAAGRIYGTTSGDFGGNDGSVFRVVKSNGQWTQDILHAFTQGECPYAGVILDRSGNLYGTTTTDNVVYELEASQGYLFQVLYTMQFGQGPLTAGLAFDSSGNLYGATLNDGGTVFQLHPMMGEWAYAQMVNFNAYLGVFNAPTLDAAGNVYGTVNEFPTIVFKLTPSGGSWTLTVLHNFEDDPSEGDFPVGGVTIDPAGNSYGTATDGGTGTCEGGEGTGCGVVWEITP